MEISKQHIILQNNIVLLEPLQLEKHFDAFVHYALQEPSTWQYSLIPAGGSKLAMHSYINQALVDRQKNIAYPFAVIDKSNNAVIGSTSFYDIDFKNNCLSLGYTWYASAYRRNGTNRNCKLLLLEYAFNNLEMQRVEFRADINNNASINAMKAIGCKEEGILRSHSTLPNGTRRTSIILSILKEEWENGGKELLLSKIC